MTSLLRRPDPAPSRAAQRKQRLLELENEQRLEDAEALKFTEEQRLSLFLSFRSVKFEWSDLDGMRSVRRRYNSSCASPPPTTAYAPAHHGHGQTHPYARRAPALPRLSTPSLPTLSLPTLSPAPLPTLSSSPSSLPTATPTPTPSQPPQQFAVLTNAHLASFGKDDTIRGDPRGYDFPPPALRSVSSSLLPSSTSTTSTSTLSPSSILTGATAPPGFSRSVSAPSTPAKTHRSPTKRRSPVKGLFALPITSVSTTTASASCVSPIRVPLPPLSSALGAGALPQGGADDDEDAWIDEDDDTIIADADADDLDLDSLRTPVPGDAEDALPTPVPWVSVSSVSSVRDCEEMEERALGIQVQVQLPDIHLPDVEPHPVPAWVEGERAGLTPVPWTDDFACETPVAGRAGEGREWEGRETPRPYDFVGVWAGSREEQVGGKRKR
ncbi:hypothetical protein DFH06DRAFT_582694 [Mycena polygramma]|nr:hypothetical protein DFH06DRAFT_582694 [Mycena polygramma]